MLGLAVLWVIGTVTSKSEERERRESSSTARTASLPRSTFRGQPIGIYERDFTWLRSPSSMGEYLFLSVATWHDSAAAVVSPDHTLAAFVRKVKNRSEVLDNKVRHICFQWNARLERDEYGNERGHRPAFWVILDTDTIRRIGNPGAVARHDWLGHYVEFGLGRWGEPTSARRNVPGTIRPSRRADTGRSGSPAATKPGMSTSDFVARYEALKKQSGDVLGVRLLVFLRAFGPPDDKLQAGGVLMGASYDCVDGSVDVAVTEPPNQWVPWIRVRAPDTKEADANGARTDEAGSTSSSRTGTEREVARREREAEALREREAEAVRKQREAEEERARQEQREAKRKAATERFQAAVPGVYRAAHVPGSYLGLGDETDLRYELVLGADGTAGAALFVRGRVRWKASGTWKLLDESRPSGRGLNVSFLASGSSGRLPTRIEAGAQWSDAQDAPLFGRSAGQDRPAGVYRIQGPFFGQDLQPVELVRTGGAPSSVATTDLEELVDARHKKAAGKYVPTDATAKTLRAKYRGRVSYRLTLKKSGNFSLFYDIPRAKAVRMSGTWDWDGTTLTLRATKGNGRTLRRAKVDRFSFNGTTIDMDGIILEKD